MLEFRVLGPIELYDGEQRVDVVGQRQLALLTYLFLHPNQFVATERLSADLWPKEVGTVKRLQVSVTRLRSSLKATPATARMLLTVTGGYRLEVPPGCVDADRFRAGCDGARAALADGDAAAALTALDAALTLSRGAPLADLQDEEFALPEINRLLEEQLSALELRFECLLALGRHRAAVPELEQLCAQHPDREGLVAALMLALYRCGRQADALAAYQHARRSLDERYGLLPGEELRRMEQRVLDHSPELDLPPPPRPQLRRQISRRVPAQGQFVGRRKDVDALSGHLLAVHDGERRVVVISGEPGIGKTHLVARLEQLALERKARVLYGGAEDDSLAGEADRDETALPYQPFVEALEGYVTDERRTLEAAGLGPELVELGRILPHEGSPAEPSGEPSMQRFRLFEAVATVLTWAAQEQPTVLILDDLQAADRSSHQLLRHLVRAAPAPRLLVVAVHRDDNLRPFLSSLRREGVVSHLPVAGLARDDAAKLVRAHLPEAPETTVDRLVDATGGNPLFVRELAGSMLNGATVDMPDELDPPESVMYLVEQSLDRFDDDTIAVLRAAAVAGRDFDLATVASCVRRDETDVVDALEGPLNAGLIREHWSVPDRFSFSHALVRAGLYQNLPKSKRTRLHRRAGEALEAPKARGHATELAHHFWNAREVGGAPKAVKYLDEAGRLADAARAWEDAERHYRRGLLAYELLEHPEPARRGALMLAHGHALERSGEAGQAKAAFLGAAGIARELDDGALLARAALGYGRAPSGVDHADPVLLELLEEALGRLEESEQALRSRILGRYAVELVSVPGADARADAWSRDAVLLAELTGDDSVLAVALASRHWTLVDPHRLEERCRVARESLAAAERAEDLERIVAGRQWWIFDLLELGQIPEVVEQVDAYEQLAKALRHPSDCGYASAMRAMLRLLAGDLVDARRFVREANQLLVRAHDPDAGRVHALQSFALGLQAGEHADAAAAARALSTDTPLRAALLGWALAAAGEPGEAQRIVPAAGDVPPDRAWLATVTALAHVAALARDAGAAARLRVLLGAFEERIAALEGIVAFGPVAEPLAGLALVLGDAAEAERLRALATAWGDATRACLGGARAADQPAVPAAAES